MVTLAAPMAPNTNTQTPGTDFSPKGIYRKVSALMKAVGPIAKDTKADGLRYKFRSIDDLYNALQPAMVDLGIVESVTMVPGTYTRELREVQGKNGTRLMTMVTYHMAIQVTDVDDGSSMILGVGPAEGYDDSDKAAGKAMSYGAKSIWFHALCIPTEDPDGERPDTSVTPTHEKAVALAVSLLSSADSLDELRATWADVPANVKADPRVVAAKDGRKANLPN